MLEPNVLPTLSRYPGGSPEHVAVGAILCALPHPQRLRVTYYPTLALQPSFCVGSCHSASLVNKRYATEVLEPTLLFLTSTAHGTCGSPLIGWRISGGRLTSSLPGAGLKVFSLPPSMFGDPVHETVVACSMSHVFASKDN